MNKGKSKASRWWIMTEVRCWEWRSPLTGDLLSALSRQSHPWVKVLVLMLPLHKGSFSSGFVSHAAFSSFHFRQLTVFKTKILVTREGSSESSACLTDIVDPDDWACMAKATALTLSAESLTILVSLVPQWVAAVKDWHPHSWRTPVLHRPSGNTTPVCWEYQHLTVSLKVSNL